jgi:hypothetical protein
MMAAELSALAEVFVCASAPARAPALKALVAGLREALQTGDVAGAASVLRRVVSPTLDFTSAQALCRVLTQLRGCGVQSPQKSRLAVLGSFTTKQLVALLELGLFAAGIDAEIYEADYGVFRQEILDPQSGLYEFGPRVVFLATSWRDLARRPNLRSDREEVARVIRFLLCCRRARSSRR